jgi:hypothetical protein
MNKDKGRLPPFVPLFKETLKTPAWRKLSHGARSLYVALKCRYNPNNHNNGRLYLSQRDARREIGSTFKSIARWFRELQHYGFIVQMKPGSLGLNGKGTAPWWRLTEVGYMRDPPTKDFLKWDGTPFVDVVQARPSRRKKSRTPLRKSATPRCANG